MAEDQNTPEDPIEDGEAVAREEDTSGSPKPVPVNRPAENAKVVSASEHLREWDGGMEATDFLGLNAEILSPLEERPLQAPIPLEGPAPQAATPAPAAAPAPPAPAPAPMAETPAESTPHDHGQTPASKEDSWFLADDAHAEVVQVDPEPVVHALSYDDEVEAASKAPRLPDSELDAEIERARFEGFDETPKGGLTRFLVPGLAAAAFVGIGFTVWQLYFTGADSVDPLELNGPAGGGVSLVRPGGTETEPVNTRHGVNPDGTTTVDPGQGQFTVPDGGNGPDGAGDPTVTEGPPPTPEELEAIGILASLDALADLAPPAELTPVPWREVFVSSLADGYLRRVTSVRSEEPDLLAVGSMIEADVDPGMDWYLGDGPDVLFERWLKAALESTAAPTGGTTDGVALTDLGPDPRLGELPPATGMRAEIRERLASGERSILDQSVAAFLAGDTALALEYVALLGSRSALAPGAHDPYLFATLGFGDEALSGTTPMPDGVTGGGGIEGGALDEGIGGSTQIDPEAMVAEVETAGGRSRRKLLKDHWYGEEVPFHEINRDARLLTPRVGDVRVVYVDGEVFEGRLFGLGEGKIWLETKLGRIVLEGARTESVARTATGWGGLAAGSDSTAGLPRVRVRAPGGIIIGHQVSRVGDQVTLLTESGHRLTLRSDDVVNATTDRVVVGIKKRRSDTKTP